MTWDKGTAAFIALCVVLGIVMGRVIDAYIAVPSASAMPPSASGWTQVDAAQDGTIATPVFRHRSGTCVMVNYRGGLLLLPDVACR